MVGSRLLFAGYGSSVRSRPREAGLLALDTVFVVDEAHLNRQFLTTARRVAGLVRQDASQLGVPALQAVAMTATQPSAGGVAIGVRAEDLATVDSNETIDRDETLRHRLTRPKPVTLVASEHWGERTLSIGRLADDFARLTVEMLTTTGGPVGCVVNTVSLATEVADRLRSITLLEGASPAAVHERGNVVTLVGRMRPHELAQTRNNHEGLFSLGGRHDVAVVVATQTIEVGVDMDLAGLVTQLAPGSAIAQRAGRVNRSGTRPQAPIVVVTPSSGVVPEKTAAPYDPEDLAASATWLGRLADTPQGLAPWAIHPAAGGNVPPAATPPRVVWQRVEPWDVHEWSRTGDDLAVVPDVDLWLSDSLDTDLAASLVVREGLPLDPSSAAQQIGATPPLPHELFPVPLGDLRRIIKPDDARRSPLKRVFVVRPSEVSMLSGDALKRPIVRPGDIVVVDGSTRAFRDGVATWLPGYAAEDVGELDASATSTSGDRWARVAKGAPVTTDDDGRELPGVTELLRDLLVIATAESEIEFDEPVRVRLADRTREWLDGLASDVAGEPRRRLLRRLVDGVLDETPAPDDRRQRSPEVAWSLLADPTDPEAPELFWIVYSGAEVSIDDDSRQVWRPSLGAVDLDDHSETVARAARDIAERVAIAAGTREALALAGRWHDVGKSDERFQRALRARSTDQSGRVLAKSGLHSFQTARRARAASGLPPKWRHEQLSAALVWEHMAHADSADRDIVTRLVGTSHGHGRHEFPHTAHGLLPTESPSAILLYDHAEWERLLARTELAWGTWGCAYLEALLRAADVTTSRSGS